MRVRLQVVRRDPVNDDLEVLDDSLGMDTSTDGWEAEDFELLGRQVAAMFGRVDRRYRLDENRQVVPR